MRVSDRKHNQVRSIIIKEDVFSHASGSVLIEYGSTKVLCAVNIEDGVPKFLKGKGIGWLTAEYAMLPAATFPRSVRESTCGKPSGRSAEISRLIGRCLRTVCDFSVLKEKTIHIDCDVLNADGGTRTVAITGACYALRRAQEKWLREQIVSAPFLVNDIAAISVALCGGEILLDPDYQEDVACDADFNFVITRDGKIIEVQGTAEKAPVPWEQFCEMKELAASGIAQLFKALGQ